MDSAFGSAPAHDLLRHEGEFESWHPARVRRARQRIRHRFRRGTLSLAAHRRTGESHRFFRRRKSREEIREALRARILLFNVESPPSLICSLRKHRGCACAPRPPFASIRTSKPAAIRTFPPDSIATNLESTGRPRAAFISQHRDSRWIDWQGISAHIGSQILTLAPYRRALTRLAGFVRELATRRHRAALSGLRRRARDSLHVGAAAGKSGLGRGARARRPPARLPPADRAGTVADRSRRRPADACAYTPSRIAARIL